MPTTPITRDRTTTHLAAYLQRARSCEPLTPEEEKKLVLKAKQGDLVARNRIVASTLRFVHLLTMRRFPPHLREDVFQQVAVAVIRAFDSFGGESCGATRFVTFAGQAAKWRMTRIHSRLAADTSEPLDTDPVDATRFGDSVDRKDELEWVRTLASELLATLDERERAVLMRKAAGATYREIGAELQTCHQAVASIMARAIRQLRGRLATTLTHTQREAIEEYFAGGREKYSARRALYPLDQSDDLEMEGWDDDNTDAGYRFED